MAVFGWIVIFLLTVFVSIASISLSLFTIRVSGSIGGGWVFLIISAAMLTFCYYTFPFEVTLK